jgi:cytochrome c peroxidase
MLVLALLAACGGGGSDSSTPTATPAAATPATPATPAAPTLTDKVAVGDKLFNEVRLSAGGNLACATCHVEGRGHADAEGTFLPLGGARLDQQGLRSSPSVRYLNANTAFRFDGQGNAEGGFTWDGRANDRAAQALGPLLASKEMANPDAATVVAKTRALSYFNELAFAYSLPAAASDAQVLAALQQALADYQSGDPDYEPFSSKFDAVQDGRAAFTPAEARGLAAFNDPDRGNCASCHSSRPAPGQTRALFTNFSYFALGLPRNRSTATADPAFFDLGLCGPIRTDLSHRNDLCGQFKVPTLRNVALTAPYFHNAAITTLEDAVAFYATRDTDPARWYPTVGGVVQKFNDLPVAYQGNVTQRAPFGLRAGATPRLSAQDVQDIAAFMRTLNDGFTP